MTEIEKACFTSSGAHWVSSISYCATDFSFILHPANDAQSEVEVAFSNVSKMRIDVSYNEEELSFPWDIIGIESRPLEGERWEFVLHADLIEFSFQARWPSIEANVNSNADRVTSLGPPPQFTGPPAAGDNAR
jgi:hypothetical protein